MISMHSADESPFWVDKFVQICIFIEFISFMYAKTRCIRTSTCCISQGASTNARMTAIFRDWVDMRRSMECRTWDATWNVGHETQRGMSDMRRSMEYRTWESRVRTLNSFWQKEPKIRWASALKSCSGPYRWQKFKVGDENVLGSGGAMAIC